MPEDTLVTCPKHGLTFNRAHYFECEQCRGGAATAQALESPISSVWMLRLKGAAALLAIVSVVYAGLALTRTKPKLSRPEDAGTLVAGLPCAQLCAQDAEACFVDCAPIGDDRCKDTCMPQMEHCANRCQPALQVADGIGVIESGLAGPGLKKAIYDIYKAWTPDELPDRAYVRLSIDGSTGTVRDIQGQVTPAALASVVASTFKHAAFPKTAGTLDDDEPGRREGSPPYVVYLVMQL